MPKTKLLALLLGIIVAVIVIVIAVVTIANAGKVVAVSQPQSIPAASYSTITVDVPNATLPPTVNPSPTQTPLNKASATAFVTKDPCGHFNLESTNVPPKITQAEAMQILKDKGFLNGLETRSDGSVITNTATYRLGSVNGSSSDFSAVPGQEYYIWLITFYNFPLTSSIPIPTDHSYVSYAVDVNTKQVIYGGDKCGGINQPENVVNTATGLYASDKFAGAIFVTKADNTAVGNTNGFNPVFAPDGQHIAFSDGTNSKIEATDLNGQDLRDYCKNKSKDYQLQLLRWSPDGKYIAVSENKDIYLCDTKTMQLSEVKMGASSPIDFYDWTADSKYVVWQVQKPDGKYVVYYGQFGKETSGAITITESNQEFVAGRISPDGKTLALSNITNVTFFSMPGQTSPLAGKVLTPAHPSVEAVAWTADGQYMALLESGYVAELYSLDSNRFGQDVEVLSDMTMHIDWSRQ